MSVGFSIWHSSNTWRISDKISLWVCAKNTFVYTWKGKVQYTALLENHTMVPVYLEGPEPEEGVGSSGGALRETHHNTGKHTKVRRMLQCTRALVPECAAGKWRP